MKKELEKMSIKISLCPSCNKEALEDIFEPCQFCGKTLEQEALCNQ